MTNYSYLDPYKNHTERKNTHLQKSFKEKYLSSIWYIFMIIFLSSTVILSKH